ncbi:MAG: ABC transporter ATP-binding protein [Rhodospirillales bacterium]|nr:ABC transporter ATP-binding protein [Rhodospirillales bacterium]
MALLEVRGVTRRFGGLLAVNDLSLTVEAGSIHGLIGPNGAGKTTTFNIISGFYTPSAGQVLYGGQDISGLPTHRIAALGVVRTFQGTTLVQPFSVYDNVLLGCHLTARASLLSGVMGSDRAKRKAAAAQTEEALRLFDLWDRRGELAGNLPHGLQRALGMAVAMAAKPKLLLLDEPFTGMNPEETRRMMELMRRLKQLGVTLLLVEHDMQAVMGLCERITVMNFGSLLAEGEPEEIRENPEVVAAYLGAADFGIDKALAGETHAA